MGFPGGLAQDAAEMTQPPPTDGEPPARAAPIEQVASEIRPHLDRPDTWPPELINYTAHCIELLRSGILSAGSDPILSSHDKRALETVADLASRLRAAIDELPPRLASVLDDNLVAVASERGVSEQGSFNIVQLDIPALRAICEDPASCGTPTALSDCLATPVGSLLGALAEAASLAAAEYASAGAGRPRTVEDVHFAALVGSAYENLTGRPVSRSTKRGSLSELLSAALTVARPDQSGSMNIDELVRAAMDQVAEWRKDPNRYADTLFEFGFQVMAPGMAPPGPLTSDEP